MATPTGQIAFSDLNGEILQATTSNQLNMNTAGVRLGYGSTSQLSISELKKAYGATITCGSYTDKFGTITGYNPSVAIGSIDDGQYTPGYYVVSCSSGTFGGTNSLYTDPASTGFLPSGINRIAASDSLRSVTGADDPSGQTQFDGSLFPGSGTATFGVRWA